MEAIDRTAGDGGELPGRFLSSGRLACFVQVLLAFGVSVWVWGAPSIMVGDEEIVILGQSPPGPLLDDREPGSWLDDVPAPNVGDEGVSVRVGKTNSVAAEGNVFAHHQPGTIADGAWYGNQPATGAWPEEGLSDSEAGTYGGMLRCPQCGGPFSVTSPRCSGELVPEPGFLSGGLAGLRSLGTCGPIAGCREMLEPVTRESWLFRPFSAGWFMGFMQGNELVDDWVGQEQGFFGGYRFGWDFDPYWGCETRFGFASVALYDSDRAKAAQAAADFAKGLPADDPYYYRFDTRRDSGVRVWDVEMLWYPFGDTYLRPYFLLGLGTARVDFMDRLSDRRIKSVLAMPIALGFKYRVQDWLALRVEATDNFIAGAGSGFKNLHNFSLTGGLEVRFGGTRTGYWPYYPGRHYW